MEYRKNNSGNIENLYKIIDGIVFGFGVNPTRFIFLFIGIAIILIYHRKENQDINIFSIITILLPWYLLILILDSNAFENINISKSEIIEMYIAMLLIIIMVSLYLKFHPEIDIQNPGLLYIIPLFLLWFLAIFTSRIITDKLIYTQ